MICHPPDTQVSGRPISWSLEITGGLGWLHLSRNTLRVMICVSRWKIAHSNLLDHSCLKMSNRPWEIISTDLITQLPESNDYNAICVIVDRLTKRAHFIPINNWFSSKDIAQLLYDKVYPLHRLPLQIISDRGVQYSAELFQEWYKILGIEFTMSTAYHL